MSYPQLIGITGRARAGKDTIASHLVERHGYTRMAFADPIRDMLAVLGVDGDHMNTYKEEIIPHLGISYRHLAQTLGTEWGRQLHGTDFWVNVLDRRKVTLHPHAQRIVISDVRYNNEARYIRQCGGTIWHVERPDNPVGLADHAREHPSETGVDNTYIDARLINHTIPELREAIDLALGHNSAKPANPCDLMDRLGEEARQFFPDKDAISEITVLDAIRFAHYLLMNKLPQPAPWDLQTR